MHSAIISEIFQELMLTGAKITVSVIHLIQRYFLTQLRR
jgi:hypothetical protein